MGCNCGANATVYPKRMVLSSTDNKKKVKKIKEKEKKKKAKKIESKKKHKNKK